MKTLIHLKKLRPFANLIDKFGLTHQEVGEVVGRSRTAVSNCLRLLALASPVKEMLSRGELEMGHARALLTLHDLQQTSTAQIIVGKQLSVRAAEALVKKLQQSQTENLVGGKISTNHRDPDITRLENKLADQFGAKVTIQHSKMGSGKLQISYSNLDEFEGIVNKLLKKKK